MEVAKIYHGGGRRIGGGFGGSGSGPSANLISAATSRFIGAAEFMTPVGAGGGYVCDFAHYYRTGSGLSFSMPSWFMPTETDDPVLHAVFMLPDGVNYAAPFKMIPLFAVDSVATGTGVRFDCGGRLVSDGSTLTLGATVDRKDTVIAPAVETAYYGTEHNVTPAGGPALLFNVQVRRIYGGGDAPANQYTGGIYFFGVRVSWGIV